MENPLLKQQQAKSVLWENRKLVIEPIKQKEQLLIKLFSKLETTKKILYKNKICGRINANL